MRTIFAIDIGNTSTKIAVVSGKLITLDNSTLATICLSTLNITKPPIMTPLLELLKSISSAKNKIQFAVSSVVDNSLSQHILAVIQAYIESATNIKSTIQFKVKIWTTQDILAAAGIKNALELSHLGSDRALKIFYLKQLPEPTAKICFSCGTAFTLEVVKNNQLVESMILPGLEMQLKSLYRNTAKLPALKMTDIEVILHNKPSFSTESSIIRGILTSYTTLIQQVIHTNHQSDVFMSGGYAQLLHSQLGNLAKQVKIIRNIETSVLLKLD